MSGCLLGQLEENMFVRSLVLEINLGLVLVDMLKLLVVNDLVGVVQAVLLFQDF